MSEIIKWLESPEGEAWSIERHMHFRAGNLITIKDDLDDSIIYCWSA